MRLVVLSGGAGAGKTTFAETVLGASDAERVSLADGLRRLLEVEHPDVDWFNRDPTYKDTPHEALDERMPRERLIEQGNAFEKTDLGTLARFAVSEIEGRVRRAPHIRLVVDDLRGRSELKVLQREADELGGRLLHVHLDGRRPDFDHDVL